MSKQEATVTRIRPLRRSGGTSLAEVVHQRRRDAKLTLQELGERSGLATSTLSKIENGQISPTFETIQAIADGLGLGIAEIFAGHDRVEVSGRRTITKKGEGIRRPISQYDYELLCAELVGKQFIPLLTTVKARSTAEFPGLVKHDGEEFFFVLKGSVTLHTEHWAEATLEEGDSAYFDSKMGHAIVSAGDEDAQILWICSRVIAPLL